MNHLSNYLNAEYHKMMTAPIQEWPTGIINKLLTQKMANEKNTIEINMEPAMADLPVTVQLTYGDLKLLEEAKVYGTKNPYRISFQAAPTYCFPYSKEMILEQLRKERKAISKELWEECDQLNAVLPFIDRLINRIEELP